jgi:hypothetical protein
VSVVVRFGRPPSEAVVSDTGLFLRFVASAIRESLARCPRAMQVGSGKMLVCSLACLLACLWLGCVWLLG